MILFYIFEANFSFNGIWKIGHLQKKEFFPVYWWTEIFKSWTLRKNLRENLKLREKIDIALPGAYSWNNVCFRDQLQIDFKFILRHMKLADGWLNICDALENFNKHQFSKMSLVSIW